MLAYLLLRPFDFSVPFGFRWTQAPPGVAFDKNAQLRSRGSTERLARRLAEGPFSLELWASSAWDEQRGPAVLLIHGKWLRGANLALAQAGQALLVESRAFPEVLVPDVFERDVPRHLVITWDAGQRVVFVDGVVLQRDTPEAPRRRWLTKVPLVLGSLPAGGLWWRGRLAGLGIYDRALPEAEVRRHFELGPRRTRDWPAELRQGLLVRYDFSEGEGTVARDTSRAWPPINLERPQGKWISLGQPGGRLEVIANVLLFIPLGLLVGLRSRRGLAGALPLAAGVGLLASLGFESLQYFLPTRFSTVLDVGMNGLGAAIGGVACSAVRPIASRVGLPLD